MKAIKIAKYYLTAICIILTWISYAQEYDSKAVENLMTSDLSIHEVFETYKPSKRKGISSEKGITTIVQKSEVYIYKSIIVEGKPKAAQFIKECVEKDKTLAESVKEVISGGQLSTLFLRLKPQKEMYRFILFNYEEDTVTLAYIESNNKDILKIILKKE